LLIGKPGSRFVDRLLSLVGDPHQIRIAANDDARRQGYAGAVERPRDLASECQAESKCENEQCALHP